MASSLFENVWKSIQEFPEYEISFEGVIRHKETRMLKPSYLDANGYPVTKFWKGQKRVLRSVEKLRRYAFSI